MSWNAGSEVAPMFENAVRAEECEVRSCGLRLRRIGIYMGRTG